MSNVVDDLELVDDNGNDVTATAAATAEESDFSMPEKFAGKSAEEIVQSYTELEKELGRKNNEVGELRKLTDQYLHQELSRQPTDKEDPTTKEDTSIGFDDLVDNPTEVIDKVVAKKLEGVEKRFDELTAAQRAEKFFAANQDYNEISQSQEFYNWVNTSPYRARQLAAAQSGDFDAAEDLLQGFRDTAQVAKEEAQTAEQNKRDEQLRQASSESAGTGASPDKIYSRSKLMAMYINDPAKYASMREEIDRAYAEGRVK
jgi:hypothetical protein